MFLHMRKRLRDRNLQASPELCRSMPCSIRPLVVAVSFAALLTPGGALAATQPENGAVAFAAKRAGSRVIYTR